MPIDTISTATTLREREKVRSIVENSHCPSCGKKLKDVTEDFHSGRIDLSKTTCFFVITTEVIKAVGKCPGNCRGKITKERSWLINRLKRLIGR